MEIVEKFKNKPTKVAMTRSKLKQIEHMEKIAPPQRYDIKAFHANFQPEVETGKEVFTARNLQIGYDRVLSEVNLTLERGQKLGIVGGNGLGKSTFLKILAGLYKPNEGFVYLNSIDMQFIKRDLLIINGCSNRFLYFKINIVRYVTSLYNKNIFVLPSS